MEAVLSKTEGESDGVLSKLKQLMSSLYQSVTASHATSETADSIWNKVKDRYPITVNRTKKYLNWRFFDHPFLDYHFLLLKENNSIMGFAIIRFEDNNEEPCEMCSA